MMAEDYSSYLNPALRRIDAYSVEGGQEADIKLNQNESPFDLPLWMKDAIMEEFKREPWNRYPDILPFRGIRAYSEFLGISPEWVTMSNGSNEMLYTIFLACLEKGSRVLIPQPSFSLYDKLAILLQAEIVHVPMHEDLSFDVEGIVRAALRQDVRFIVLSTPNNPTSKSMSLDEIRTVAAETGALVLVDEAYIEFSRQESALGLIGEMPNVMVLRTMSKALALAGMRIGFTITNPSLLAEIAKPKIPFTSGRLAEITLRHVLDNYSLVEKAVKSILEERRRVYEALRSIEGVKSYESDANFIIIKVCNATRVFDTLAAKGILVRNVSGYPLMQDCLRFNIGLKQENDFLVSELEKTVET